jgi:hypothetical protein
MKEYKNRYGDVYTFELLEDGNVLWKGGFEYHRVGYRNDYEQAYKAFHNDFPATPMLSFSDFKAVLYKEVGGDYPYKGYWELVKPTKVINMVDPSGGPCISEGESLTWLSIDKVVSHFEHVGGGYLIHTKDDNKNSESSSEKGL